MTPTRQLAAIMFVDIAGFTALMGADEATAMQLRDKLKNKLTEQTSLHCGRIIKFSGDGALCSFESAGESVRAAIAVQLSMQQEPIVPLRMGIHQADVVFEDGDVHGDGVNIASRLESLAITGSIFISAKVYDDIKNQRDIQTTSLGKYVLKNVPEPVEIFAVSNPGLVVPHNIKLEGKGEKYIDPTISKKRKANILRLVVPLIIVGIATIIFLPPWFKKQHARNELMPTIQKMLSETFRANTQIFDMALEAEKYLSDDSALAKLWPVISTTISIETTPEGAEVYWKDYNTPHADWRLAGVTPLKDLKFPRSFLRLEIRKTGFHTIEYAGPGNYARIGPDIAKLTLDAVGSIPENMVRIPKKITRMEIVGIEKNGGKEVGEFLIDKFEVTNKQFKAFMDAGGYSNKTFWKYPILFNGKEITLDAALEKFIDRTGRPGSANWEAGSFPDEKENHPVTGISWYEAAAYAAYVNKQLPTIFHWARIAETSRTEFIVPLSNYNGKSTTVVGSMPGFNSFGVYDVAGNAREWCFNQSDNPTQRFILGGGWNEPTYSFNDSYTQAAMDRSIANGFRCFKELPGDTALVTLMKPVSIDFRDYKKEKPVDDKTFAIFLSQFTYDKKPLNAKVENTLEGEIWKAEMVSFDAGYNNERMQAYIYFPKNFTAPLQPILFFPGSGDIYSKKFNPEAINNRIDFIIKSNRALVVPVYKGTHERHDSLHSDLQEETVFYKDHVIMWRKDIGRTIDYLETRKDIQADKLGYLGWSWGGFMGGIIPAIEKRFKAVVLNVGGMEMNKTLPEVDQINFLPRVTQPVLMLNGKHDMFFPVETSQKPMFDFLGTPKKDKKIIIYEAGHLVPRTDFVKETLIWYDQYLGPVK